MFNKPKNNISYIVRENITAYVIPTSSQVSMKIKSEDDEQMVSNLKLVDCKTSVIKAGDIVQIVGQVYIMHSSASSTFSAKVNEIHKHFTTPSILDINCVFFSSFSRLVSTNGSKSTSVKFVVSLATMPRKKTSKPIRCICQRTLRESTVPWPVLRTYPACISLLTWSRNSDSLSLCNWFTVERLLSRCDRLAVVAMDLVRF